MEKGRWGRGVGGGRGGDWGSACEVGLGYVH